MTDIATDAFGLAQLQARLEQDLAWLELPAKRWVVARELEGAAVLEVAVIGAGMAGMAAAASLTLSGTVLAQGEVRLEEADVDHPALTAGPDGAQLVEDLVHDAGDPQGMMVNGQSSAETDGHDFINIFSFMGGWWLTRSGGTCPPMRMERR